MAAFDKPCGLAHRGYLNKCSRIGGVFDRPRSQTGGKIHPSRGRDFRSEHGVVGRRKLCRIAGLAATALILCLWCVSLLGYIEFRALRFGGVLGRGRLHFDRFDGPAADLARYAQPPHGNGMGFSFHSGTWIPISPELFGLILPWASGPFPGGLAGITQRFWIIPLWIPFLLIGGSTAWSYWRDRRRRFGSGRCLNCGYDLTGNVSGRCPECGSTIGAQWNAVQKRPVSQYDHGQE